MSSRLEAWLGALEARHLASLRFAEVTRALRALSSAYVGRRHRLIRGGALDGGGKRAAFALFYGPLHLLTVWEILQRVQPAQEIDTIVDLGCGTGAAGAAWALHLQARPRLVGVDRHQWAVGEAEWTYRMLGLRGRAAQADGVRFALPTRRTGVVGGWLLNELPDDGRDAVSRRLLDAHERGASILIVEPIARGVSPWWDDVATVFQTLGGRADEWRFDVPLPGICVRLGRAAGLTLRELTARSLWVEGRHR